MDLIRFGIDTVRVARDFAQPLPMVDLGYWDALADRGWVVNCRLELGSAGERFESRTGFWQDPENSSIRGQIQNAGRTLVTEFSVPRVISSSVLNLDLATFHEAQEATNYVWERIQRHIPLTGVPFRQVLDTEPRYRRADWAADVAAGVARPGLIAAAGQFLMPGARKIVRQQFPGETGKVSGQTMTFRGYDKARELCSKTDALLMNLDLNEKKQILDKIEQQRASGAVRLELAMTPKKKPLGVDDMQTGNIKWADVIERGFNGGRLYIGGLDKIRQEVDSRRAIYATETMMAEGEERRFRWKIAGEFSPTQANGLIAFAVRYAELGEAGMLAEMSRATFYRHRKAFLDAGLKLDELTSYRGEIDLTGVIEQVRAS